MPIKYPVRKWLGKYEAWLWHLYGRRSMLYNDKYLERFFSHFPEASGLEQFGTPDVFEYKKWREQDKTISAFKVMQEIKCVEKFYRYLIEDQGLPLSNPAKPFIKQNPRLIVRRKKDSLRLEEYKRLFETCIKYEPRLVHWMVWMVQGVGSHDRHMTSQKAGRLFKKVAVLAGLPYVTMQLVKRSLRNGLWREIIKDWSNRVLTDNGYVETHHARPEHTELSGDAFAHVQVSADDVWASVCDSCDDIPAIASNEQESPEPQSP
jgi:hypothetical protein